MAAQGVTVRDAVVHGQPQLFLQALIAALGTGVLAALVTSPRFRWSWFHGALITLGDAWLTTSI